MTRKKTQPAADVAAGEPAHAGYYDVKLNARFNHQDHLYLPGHIHHVDQGIHDEMEQAGVIESAVKLVS